MPGIKKIFMISGLDRTGKSTLTETLVDKIRLLGYTPFVFHLTGPGNFSWLKLSEDEKSEAQLVKFQTIYDSIRIILKSCENAIIILDRTPFEEYIWSKFFQRYGKYTDILNSDLFFNINSDLIKQSVYVEIIISDIEKLAERIKISEEDNTLYSTITPVEDSVQYLQNLYKRFKSNIIDRIKIEYCLFDNSGPLEDIEKFVYSLTEKYMEKNNENS